MEYKNKNFILLNLIPATILTEQNKYLLKHWSLWDPKTNKMTTEFNEKLRRIKIDFLYTGCVKFFIWQHLKIQLEKSRIFKTNGLMRGK